MAKDYIIKPPPKDKGLLPLFRVVYTIDVDAENETQAVKKAYQMMRDKDSLAPILDVIDSACRRTQIDLSEIIKADIAVSNRYIIKEQCPDMPPVEINVNILLRGGQLWFQPAGYGEKNVCDGKGFPIGIEIWQGRLRVIVFDDIRSEEPRIIDIEKAKETRRHEEEGNRHEAKGTRIKNGLKLLT